MSYITIENGEVVIENGQAVVINQSVGDGRPGAGGVLFTTVGTHNWVVPTGVTQVSAVAVGGGGGGAGHLSTNVQGSSGGGGGGLRCIVTLNVTPGDTLVITVGEGGLGGAAANPPTCNGANGTDSIISYNSVEVLRANGGFRGISSNTAVPISGGVGGGGTPTSSNILGGNGGQGGGGASGGAGGAGGGAGGYSGNGGNASAGAGAGGGGGAGASPTLLNARPGGGGVGIFGQGISGRGGVPANLAGRGGSQGSSGSVSTFNSQRNGGIYGGGGSGIEDDTSGTGQSGANGAVRIIWDEFGTTQNRRYPDFFCYDQVNETVI